MSGNIWFEKINMSCEELFFNFFYWNLLYPVHNLQFERRYMNVYMQLYYIPHLRNFYFFIIHVRKVLTCLRRKKGKIRNQELLIWAFISLFEFVILHPDFKLAHRLSPVYTYLSSLSHCSERRGDSTIYQVDQSLRASESCDFTR